MDSVSPGVRTRRLWALLYFFSIYIYIEKKIYIYILQKCIWHTIFWIHRRQLLSRYKSYPACRLVGPNFGPVTTRPTRAIFFGLTLDLVSGAKCFCTTAHSQTYTSINRALPVYWLCCHREYYREKTRPSKRNSYCTVLVNVRVTNSR